MDEPRISELSATISKSVTNIRSFLAAKGLPYPSFNTDAPSSLPEEISDDQDAILDATAELHDLLLDPLGLLFHHGSHNNMVSLQAINRFDIARSFPVNEQVSFTQLAESSGVNEQTLQRLLRHAMTMRVFCEPRTGVVAHTAASKALTEPHIHDWAATACEEMWPAATRVIDALEKWPNSQEPNETSFALVNDTQEPMYQLIGSDPVRAMRFTGAMKAFTSSPGYDLSYFADYYDWNAIGNGLVVDVGGAQGHVGMYLAQRFSFLNILVQDMEKVVDGASSHVPPELGTRVQFMAHDIFAEQSVEADVYYFRWIFHNWSDKYSVQILRSLIPALKRGAIILIQDACLNEPGKMAQWRAKNLRSADLDMLAIFNSRERDVVEWRHLFQIADPRFEFMGITQPKGSALAIIEGRWTGDGEEG